MFKKEEGKGREKKRTWWWQVSATLKKKDFQNKSYLTNRTTQNMSVQQQFHRLFFVSFWYLKLPEEELNWRRGVFVKRERERDRAKVDGQGRRPRKTMNTGLEQSVTTVERQSGRPQRYFRGVNVNEGRLEMEEEKKKQRMKKGEREKKKKMLLLIARWGCARSSSSSSCNFHVKSVLFFWGGGWNFVEHTSTVTSQRSEIKYSGKKDRLCVCVCVCGCFLGRRGFYWIGEQWRTLLGRRSVENVAAVTSPLVGLYREAFSIEKPVASLQNKSFSVRRSLSRMDRVWLGFLFSFPRLNQVSCLSFRVELGLSGFSSAWLSFFFRRFFSGFDWVLLVLLGSLVFLFVLLASIGFYWS